jgi:hypothetical protein
MTMTNIQVDHSGPPRSAAAGAGEDSATRGAADQRAGSSDVRVSTLVGDRVCATCGFNLCGQSVVREQHYNMLMVRCPECGTVAPMMEYPLLTKWSVRFGYVLAAGWLLVLLLMIAVSSGVLFGQCNSVAQWGCMPLATEIAKLQKAHWQEQTGLKPDFVGPIDPNFIASQSWVVQQALTAEPGAYSYIDKTWWDSQDVDVIVASLGGTTKAVELSKLAMLVQWFLIPLGIGWFWAVALLHVKLRRVAIWIPLLLFVGGAVLYLVVPNTWFNTWNWWGDTAQNIAFRSKGWIVMLAAGGLSTMLVLIGVLTGRPLARLAVRGLLPPRLRGTLGYLWLATGRTPPSSVPGKS